MNNTGNVSGKRFLVWVTLVHIAFFILACIYRRIYMGDSFEYIYEAVNIRDSLFFYSGNPALPIEEEFMSQRQPLYPLFLLLTYTVSLDNWLVLALQNVLSIFNVWYARKSLFILGYKAKYDKLLFVLTLAYPIQFIYANTIAPEILLQTFTLVYIRQMVLLIMHKRWKHAGWSSAALVAGLFVKPVLYPFVVVHLVLLLIWAVSYKMHVLRATAIGIVPLVAVLLYNGWNQQRTGKFHFSSNQGFNAIYYYYFYFMEREGSKKAQDFLQGERDKMAAMPEYKARYDYANKRGISLLKENFGPYMAFHLKHSARMFIEPGKAELDLFTGKLTYGGLYTVSEEGFKATLKNKGLAGLPAYARRNPSLFAALTVLAFNLLRLAGMILFFLRREVRLPVRLFILMMLTYFALTTGPISNTHYFLPVSLVAIGIAVTGYIHWRTQRNQKRQLQ